MTKQGESLSNERGKKGGSAKPKSGESTLKSSRRPLNDIEKKMSDLVSVFSGDLLTKGDPQLSGEGNKKTQNPIVIPPLEFQKSTERQPGYYKDRLDKLDRLIDQKLKEKLNVDISIRDQPQHSLDSLESLDQGEQYDGRD
jgi:hypothetical protein